MNGSGRVAVGVSGAGSNLRALAAAADRGELGGEIRFVFSDRDCPALAWAAEQGIETALVPGGDDETLAATVAAVGIDAIVLAGYMRIVGPAVLAAFDGRIVNTHPSLLPAFPGAHAVEDALAAGVRVTGCTVHLVDATLDGGPIVAQEAVPILPGDDAATLHDRIRAVEHRLLPQVVARLLAGALTVEADGRRVAQDLRRADTEVPTPRRALLSVSDKTGLVTLGRGLVARGFELVSTGGTARTLRDAGLPVTDVAAVTGSPEMLDGRVKTLHPRIHAGLLADRRLEDHRLQLLDAGIAPFEVVVVNLYPFAAALDRPGITVDELIEEIDIGGPSMVRAAAKNHANVAIVTSPGQYDDLLAALDAPGGLDDRRRRAWALDAFAHTAAYDARIAAALPGRMIDAGLLDPPEDPYPPSLTIGLEKVETLRYGENPHQAAARYRRPGSTPADGPFASGAPPLQGKALSYNNVLDASAAAAIGRALRGPACVIVKHTNPCGAAERATVVDAWTAALEADPVSAFGGVVAVTRPVDADAGRPPRLDLPGGRRGAGLRAGRARGPRRQAEPAPRRRPRPGRRWSRPDARSDRARSAAPVARSSSPPRTRSRTTRRPGPSRRSVRRPTTSGATSTSPGGWSVVSRPTPSCSCATGGSSGSGPGRRRGSTRPAAPSPRPWPTRDRPGAAGAACASDAFYPFADAVEVCLEAGVTAFAQPGGSVRDDEVVAVADAAGATMVMTGTRHFRH